MSRTRIVKGKYAKISAGNHIISAEGNIVSNAGLEVRDNGIAKGVFYGSYERLGSDVSDDFEINFVQKKDGIYSTVVPLGILDFEGNFENPFFAFNYSLHLGNVDSLKFEVFAEDGSTIYSITNLPELVVTAKKHPKMLENITKNKPQFNPTKPVNIWDWEPSYNPFVIPVSDYTRIGSYVILWDGFDNNEIYDSTNFNNKTLKVKITGSKGDKIKSKEVEIKTSEFKVDWVDVKIDKKSSKIDTTLRVDLADGGEEGLSYGDKISQEALEYYKKPILKSRGRTYNQLLELTLKGINQFWSRKLSNIGHGVKINSIDFQVEVNASANNSGLAAPSIIYQSNMEASRSRNFELSRKLFFYEGYLYYSDWKDLNNSHPYYKNKGWYYQNGDEEDYKMVSAHEIGHEILLAYGGHIYSKTHKGSSHWSMIIQDPSENATLIPTAGEIDLMKYYKNYYDIPRTIITNFDILKLIWLTKIRIL